MKQNVGRKDKSFRYLLSAVAFALGFVHSRWWFLVSGIAFVTAFFNFCFLYRLIGIDTCKGKSCTIKKKKRKR